MPFIARWAGNLFPATAADGRVNAGVYRVDLKPSFHQIPTAAADPSMSTVLRSVGLLDVLSSTPAGSSVARLVSTLVCTASLLNLVRKAG